VQKGEFKLIVLIAWG